MRQKLTLICLFFTICYSNSQQFSLENLQTNEDIEAALDSTYLWMEVNNLKGFINNYAIIDNAISLSQNREFRARFDCHKAAFYFRIYDYDKLDYHLNRALSFYENTDNHAMLLYVYNLKAIYEYHNNEDINKAIEWNEKVLSLLKNKDEKTEQMLIDTYLNLTYYYDELKNWEASIETASKGIELSEKYKSESRLRRMYYYKGIALFHLNDIDGALKNFKLNEDLVKKHELLSGRNVYYKEARYLQGYSLVYRLLGDYKKSGDYALEFEARMEEKIDSYVKDLGVKIRKNSDLLVNLAKQKEKAAQDELEKTQSLYSYLLVGLALLIIMGLLIFIFQQRKHQKINIEKNTLLTLKNDEVENALRVKTDFLNSITHELRTPLYAINSITDMIKQGQQNFIDSTQIDILSFSGEHLLRFINDVIDFNQGNKDFEFQNLNTEACNLETLLFNIKKTIKLSLSINNGNSYNFDIDSEIPEYLNIDTLKLSRIIINLLNNASKNTKNGDIYLKVKQLFLDSKSSIIEFSIKDTGIGISKKQLAEIHLAFKNNLDLVKRIDKRASGLGLGLVMVNRLLALYGSKLNIETEVGKGTTMKFVISFNVSKIELPEPMPDEMLTNLEGIHMLIVDDNKINQMVTSKVVKKEGFTCDIAGGGNEALNLIKNNNKYDFILLDIMMPGMDGFETAKRIKAFLPGQKIIALTAMSIEENRQRFLDSGFVNVIEKPFVIKKFNVLIKSLIA